MKENKMVSFKGIIWHWTAGNYTPNKTDLAHYHYILDKEGKVYIGTHKPEDNLNCMDGNYAAHCGGGNTGRIGIALACRKDLNTQPTQKQVEAMCNLTAQLCIAKGIPVKNCETHAEFGIKNPKTSSYGKIDINHLPYAKISGVKPVGDYLRNKTNWYLTKIKGM